MATIDFDINCVGCGANLRACDSQGTCPRCARPAAETLELTAVDPADLHISGDLSCVACGYNLRTLAANSVCPECGKPIAPSLSADPLRRADRDWLISMRRGTTLLAVLTMVGALLYAPICIEFSLARLGIRFPWRFVYLARLLWDVCWCVGVILVTRPEAWQQVWAGSGRLRSWARATSVAMVICFWGQCLRFIIRDWLRIGRFSFVPTGGSGMPGLPGLLCDVAVYWLTSAAFAVSWVLLFTYLRKLGHRAGRKTGGLAVLIWTIGVYGVIQMILICPASFFTRCSAFRIEPFAGWANRFPWDLVAQLGYAVSTLGFLVALVLAFVVLRRFARMFKAAAEGRSDRGMKPACPARLRSRF